MVDDGQLPFPKGGKVLRPRRVVLVEGSDSRFAIPIYRMILFVC